MSVKTVHFWKKQWQDAIDRAPIRRRMSSSDSARLRRWNKMAPDFAENTSGVKQEAERQEIIQKMISHGALHPDATVLDIGAGPGTWALPLARHSSHVTALEPANSMAEILQSRMAAQQISNITIERRTWQSVELEAAHWYRAFDLVFASMTPGIDGPESLIKMMAASRGWCYMSAFSGSGWLLQYEPLWRVFFNEPIGEQPSDIIYPFNLVYSMGLRPSLEFSWWNREKGWTRDQAIERFILFFENYLEITETVKFIITDYISQNCNNGRFIWIEPVCRGTMIWRMQERKVMAA